MFEHWNPQVDDLSKAIELIEEYFGKPWLKEQMQILNHKPKEWHKKFTHHLKPEPHPILRLYLKARSNFEQLHKDSNIGFSKETLELMSFCDILREIKEIDIIDIHGNPLPMQPWAKFKKRLKSDDDFRQASYEIQVATALKKSGSKVFFIQECSEEREKTPDLLVQEGKDLVYVECKFRKQSERERQYNNMFNEFYWRSMRLMFRVGKFYSICVEWLKDPTIKCVESVIALLENIMSIGKQGNFETESAKIWLKFLGLKDQISEGPFDFDISEYRSDKKHVDILMQHAECGMFGGMAKHKNPAFVMFRNISYLDDIINGILELLNKAYSQIPEKGPGIVFLETRLSFLDQEIKESLQELQSKLQAKLNLIGRVNMIILTKSYFTEEHTKINGRDAQVITRKVESTFIPNPKLTSSISSAIINKIRNLKYY